MDIGIYPINTNLFKNIELDVGLLYSRILSSGFDGSTSNNGPLTTNVSNKVEHENLLRKNQIGLSARVAYKIKLTNNMYILPQYIYFLGFGGEFKDNRGGIYVQNHIVGIGIEKKLSFQK